VDFISFSFLKRKDELLREMKAEPILILY